MPTERDRIYWQLLAVRLRQGDSTAAAELIGEFQTPLLFYLRRLLQSEDEAWDCAQETWISALRGIRRLRQPEAIASYIYRVGRNNALVALRRRKVVFTIQDEEEAMTCCSEETKFTSHDAVAIREALDRLPHIQRDVLTLFFLDDLSIHEMSVALQVPNGTVKSRLFHSKIALRKILTEMGYNDEH
jgi:RNA polymerase sigma factor (sigma-70 family)